MRSAILALVTVGSACASATKAPVQVPVQAARPDLVDLRLRLEPIDLQGEDAKHAAPLALALRRSLSDALREAGLRVVTGYGTEVDALAHVELTVDFRYVDILRVHARLWVEHEGKLVFEHVEPGNQEPTPGFPDRLAAVLANQLSSSASLGKAIKRKPTTSAGQTAPQKRIVVAVFEVEDVAGKLSEETCVQLSEYLSTTAARTLGWSIVPNSQIREVVQREKAASYRVCVDEACQIDLGKAVAAEKILITKILSVGSDCAITAKLFDLRTEAAERTASSKAGCGADDLLAGIETLIEQLRPK